MRAAAGADLEIHCGATSTVVREADLGWRPTPLGRFVRVYPAADAWSRALDQVAPALSSVALAGWGPDEDRVARAVRAIGANRTCSPGRLQGPPLAWARDGKPALGVLTSAS